MKKVMFAFLALMLSGSVVSFAGDNLATKVSVMLVDERVKINAEDLPDAVKSALKSDDYSGWQISAAYKYNDKDQFDVELKQGEEVVTLKFNKNGERID